MASYVVLARKWRPAQFSDIVGQEPVVRTLANAIRAERIHHAYLLTGSRGIGKTSIARIFSKVIRCENRNSSGELSCCDQCASCKEIAAGNSVDVIEIDGASNNGVDAVREIRENAKFLPSFGKRKIYIIDEVHMLTTAAFNALLKTLEEPPAHVIFVFATTEPHKIPATILSRCQRFDLRRVTMAQIQARLLEVASHEKIQAESGALALLARAAEGSMRDALSLLDQVIAFSGNTISAQAIRESLGLIEGQALLGILRGVLSRQPREALALVEKAYEQGHDLRVLTRGLVDFLHGLILVKVGASNSSVLEFSTEEWKELEVLAPLRSLEELEMIFQVVHHGVDWIARSPQPKIVLDILLIKCATAEALVFAGQPQSGAAPVSGTSRSMTAPAASSGSVLAAPTGNVLAAPMVAVAAKTREAVPAMASVQTAPVIVESSPKNPSWENFIAHVRQKRPLLASILDHGVCARFPQSGSVSESGDGAVLGISFGPENSYFREQLQSRAYSEQLAVLSREYFSCVVRITIDLQKEGSATESVALKRERELKAREQVAREAVQKHPVIQEAKALFGGEWGPIEVSAGEGELHVSS